MDISCKNPVIILHPSFSDFVFRFDFIHIYQYNNPIDLEIRPFQRTAILNGVSPFKVFPFLPHPKLISINHIDFYFFYDPETAECVPLYLAVSCGHCECCKSKKISGLAQRMQFACEEFDNLPLFVTLTYNDAHLPECGVNYRDVQLFKKRLNKLVSEKYHVNLKYAVFSEYGEKYHRPHYHVIIYGLPHFPEKTTYFHWALYSKLICFCWRSFPKSGYKRSERFDFDNFCKQGYQFYNCYKGCKRDPYSIGYVNLSFTDGISAFKYVTKYVSKGSNVPQGKNPNVYVLSANLGMSYISKFRDYLTSNSHFLFLSKFTSHVPPRKVFLSSYYIRKLFPSQSTLVPIEFRRKWLFLCQLHNQICNSALPSWFKAHCTKRVLSINARFPNLCYMSWLDKDDSLSKAEQLEFAIRQYSILLDSGNCYFENVFQKLIDYFDDFPDDFEENVIKCIIERFKFLSNLNISSDTLFTSINYDVKQQFYKSKSIF